MAQSYSTQAKVPPRWQLWAVRYGAALGFAALALAAWFLSPAMHGNPFVLFLAAVILSARFCGFAPALFCTAVSVVVIGYLVLPPHLAFPPASSDLGRLSVFVVISVLTSSIARQKSQAELQVDETRRRMAAIVESSDDAIFSTNPEGIVTSWNRAAEGLYGFPAAEIIGQHISRMAPPERVPEILRNMERLNRGEHVASYQTERMHKDGTRVSVLLSISPLRNRKGVVMGASAIARDITAQKRAEEALRKSEKLATAGRLTATIAHEINNPLEAVTNLIYLARSDPARAGEYLRQAETEVQRVAGIAQQTLGLVRDAATAAPLDVGAMMEQVLQFLAGKLDAKKIGIVRHYGNNLEIRGFAGELRQVFSNLIVNALDALPEGGRLRLRIVRSQEWSNRRRPGVRVTVADNGCGIAPEYISHLFEPFFTTKPDVGTGVGLWLSHGIVRKHGGWIRVRSRTSPGSSGTVFSLFLPETAPQSQTA